MADTMTRSQGLTQYSLGTLIRPGQRIRPDASASKAVWKAFEWPEFCKRMKKTVAAEDDAYYVPPWLGWHEDTELELEFYTIGLPAAFDAMQPRQEIPEFLRSSQGAYAVTVIEVDPELAGPLLEAEGLGAMPVVRIVLSHYELPVELPFDWGRCPVARGEVDKVWFGVLSEGSDLIWDLETAPHGWIGGRSGGGKTEAIGAALTQLHATGEWHFIILCPDEGDPTYTPFAALGHDVICGSEVEHYQRAVGLIHGVLDDEFPARGKQRGVHGEAVWGRGDHRWRGHRVHKRILIVWEESPTWLDFSAADPQEVQDAKAELIPMSIQISQKGRKYRAHNLYVNQAPYVGAFGAKGGGAALTNIDFKLGLKSVEKKHHDTIFPECRTEAPRRVLTNSNTKPGRGVCRGAMDPGGPFAADVNDNPVQVAWLTEDDRAFLLENRVDPSDDIVAPDPDGEPGPVAVVEGRGALRLVDPAPVPAVKPDPEPEAVVVPLMEAPMSVTVESDGSVRTDRPPGEREPREWLLRPQLRLPLCAAGVVAAEIVAVIAVWG